MIGHDSSNQIIELLSRGQVTVDDIVRNLGAHRVTVYRWLASGRLKPDHSWGQILFFKAGTVRDFILKYMLPGKRRAVCGVKYARRLQYLDYLDRWEGEVRSVIRDMSAAAGTVPAGRGEALCGVGDACKLLNKSRRQVYRYIRAGKLVPAEKHGGEWLFEMRDVRKIRNRKKK